MIWTSTDIEAARRTPLVPLLRRNGYRLRDLGNGAWLMKERFPGLVVRGCQWFWKEARQQGNSIDFLMYLEGRTFADVMRTLMEDTGEDEEGKQAAEHEERMEEETPEEEQDDDACDEALPDWIRTIRPPRQSAG